MPTVTQILDELRSAIKNDSSLLLRDGIPLMEQLAGTSIDHTTEPIAAYVNTVTGDDTYDGLSETNPKKTMQAALDTIPKHLKHNVAINVRGELPSGNPLCVNFTFDEDVNFVIDGGTDTTILADDAGSPWTSDIGSTTTIGKTGLTWTTDEWKGYWVEILSGSYAGHTRQVQSNTATTLTVTVKWSGSVSGAQFRIVRPTTLSRVSFKFNCNGYGTMWFQNFFSQQMTLAFSGNSKFNVGALISGDPGLSSNIITVDTVKNLELMYNRINPSTFTAESGLSYRCLGTTVFCASYVGIQVYSGKVTARSVISPKILTDNAGQTQITDGCWIGSAVFFGSGGSWNTVLGSSLGLVRLGGSNQTNGLRLYGNNYVLLSKGSGTVDISNCISSAIEVLFNSTLMMVGAIAGTGNTKAGLYAHDKATVIIDASSGTPTVTGTVGNITVDNSTQVSTWATVMSGTPVVDNDRGVLVRKAQ